METNQEQVHVVDFILEVTLYELYAHSMINCLRKALEVQVLNKYSGWHKTYVFDFTLE